MSRPTPPAYKIRNWPGYNEALKRRGSLTIWFDPDMAWEAAPTGKRGRRPHDTDAAILTCLTMKVLFGMALRQVSQQGATGSSPLANGFVESLLRLIGLDRGVPDFSTLSRRQKTLKVNIPDRGSDGPLHLLVDSTGIKGEGEGEWTEEGRQTVQWTVSPTKAQARGLQAPGLAQAAHRDRRADTGDPRDGVHLQRHRRCPHAARVARPDPARGAAAIIPPRSNARPWKPDTAGAIARNEILRTSKRLGRTIWRRWSGYHRRSRAETKMHCVKLLGQRLSARQFDRQVAEFQVRVAVPNGFTALGIPVTEAVA